MQNEGEFDCWNILNGLFEYPSHNLLTFVGLLLGALVGSGVGLDVGGLGVGGRGVGGRGVGLGLGGGFVGTGTGFVQLGAVFVSTSNISKEVGGGGLLGTGYVGLGGRGVG